MSRSCIGGGIDLRAIEYQECLHGGMSHPFVAIDERVALNQCQTQRRRLLGERGIQVATAERGLGLGHSGLERPEVPDSRRATSCLKKAPM